LTFVTVRAILLTYLTLACICSHRTRRRRSTRKV